jgi:PhzF family phenazine biosynthesis protein
VRAYRFWQIDAFSRDRYRGNAAAVVFDASSLESSEMQAIARQMNLSETVFLCRPTKAGADYRARIFTPKNELPFAGHPTLAAAFAFVMSSAGTSDAAGLTLTQECGVGLVPVEVGMHDGAPLFTILMGPSSRRDANVDRDLASRMLGCRTKDIADVPIEICSVGLPWMIIPVRTLAALKGAIPDQPLIEKICREAEATGITAYSPETELAGCDLHIRSFAPGEGIPEDPACGSGNGAAAVHVAAHLRRDQDSFTYTAEQGLEVGRNAFLRLSVTDNRTDHPEVRLAGHAVTVMKGELYV